MRNIDQLCKDFAHHDCLINEHCVNVVFGETKKILNIKDKQCENFLLPCQPHNMDENVTMFLMLSEKTAEIIELQNECQRQAFKEIIASTVIIPHMRSATSLMAVLAKVYNVLKLM